ncbi:hypothetical protein FRC03_012487 [Tulasnella sp. 419]|nr:hypothetical protein FRC03_012487 [Tulasnella sp. 419]
MGPGVSTSVTHEPEYNTSVNASEETPSTPQSHPHSPISVVIDVNEPPDTPKPEILPVIPPVNPFVQDPKLGLDEKSKFWEEYSQYAWKYDTDLVKGLREDLQGLLTFVSSRTLLSYRTVSINHHSGRSLLCC